ncbi:hypothetical protein RM530_18105 [Algiphilus sp. W345]|uniref:DUF6946 domain-containing protein n=1 Tax=Banduia mediterranea TaxID=3075609 RepID=A0ABU2WNY4_9GAMM|nr:hypothetical protein [Algiphilus sp. W345]MDT0499258.1 hypothetical protein [Algiphilus sp. W345]
MSLKTGKVRRMNSIPIRNILVPTRGPDDWKSLLGDPEKHWVRGRSARAMAHTWEASDGFPTEIRAALESDGGFQGIVPLLICPEWKVPLPGGRRASQNDAWVLTRDGRGVVSLAIEGKVDKPFDHPLGEWKRDASPGKQTRLAYFMPCSD